MPDNDRADVDTGKFPTPERQREMAAAIAWAEENDTDDGGWVRPQPPRPGCTPELAERIAAEMEWHRVWKAAK